VFGRRLIKKGEANTQLKNRGGDFGARGRCFGADRKAFQQGPGFEIGLENWRRGGPHRESGSRALDWGESIHSFGDATPNQDLTGPLVWEKKLAGLSFKTVRSLAHYEI